MEELLALATSFRTNRGRDNSKLLLRSHQASQQTNFGCWTPCARSHVDLRFLHVSISPHLPRFLVIEIKALSIRKNF